MSIMDDLKRLARPYEEEEEDVDDNYDVDYEEEEEEEEPAPRPARRAPRAERAAEKPQAPASSSASLYSNSRNDNSKKVVSINSAAAMQVVLVKPDRFENAPQIAEHLQAKRTVVLNLEDADKSVARRLLDFLSGVAFANNGKIQRIAASTYIITPFNVEFTSELIDELENNGLYS